ncbi:MAG TPA: chemotaxis protein CheA [Anaeromyxobacteraceae bacterium]|nr:chemotaxis protein CheA [Anaeromyxobacteraceae bacterium]
MADQSQRLADFLSEAQESVDSLGKDLLHLDGQAEPDPDLLNAVFRAAHTLKGLASMFGVERMARLAHALEDVLDDVRMGRREADRGTLDLLLEAPEVFTRIMSEEAAGAVPQTGDAAGELARRLRAGAGAAAGAAGDALEGVGLGPEIRGVLTEYEEHRLRANVAKGIPIHRVKVGFELAVFDRELSALSSRLKPLGEVVSTLPSHDVEDPDTIGFDLLFASPEPIEAIQRAVGPAGLVEALGRAGARERAPAPPPARADGAAVPPPADFLLEPAGPAQAPPGSSWSPAPPREPEVASLRSASQAVRVDIRTMDRLMNVVGELVLVKTSLGAVAERLKIEGGDPVLTAELHRANRSLERKLAELQSGILEVRMVPLEQVFDKLARMVRKIAREVGKEIELSVTGGDVEIDKLIVEELSDPLMHLIRNAIDHAVEPAEARERMGKPRAGRITLAAAQKGNHVEIVVEDDGAGIDEERIREVAVQRGLAAAEAVRGMTRREVMNLIFVPGFSTARQVTSLSGRGVGMDVVKNNIANLSGIIELHSVRGHGTRFEITLPTTLAIVRALVVAVAGRTYAVPLNSVLEILQVGAAEVRTLSNREVITLRGATLPLVRLSSFFALRGARAADPFYVVVVGLAQERLGIAVDDLLGQQDIVVKPLGRILQGVRGIAGATDLGNLHTVLVLDVGSIIEDVTAGEPLRDAAV